MIVRTGSYEFAVRRNSCNSDPLAVTSEGLGAVAGGDLPYLDALVPTSTYKEVSSGHETH